MFSDKFMQALADELGLEIGEVFNVEGYSGNPYKIELEGIFRSDGNFVSDMGVAELLLNRDSIRHFPWRPKAGELYYIPSFHLSAINGAISHYWCDGGDQIDAHYLEQGLVFKTEEEAKAARDKMLAALKK